MDVGSLASRSIEYDVFRQIMGSLASGISVVTAVGQDGGARGLTCSAVCSVSADPPLLLCCVRTPSSTLDALRVRGGFAVNFLDSRARALSDLFASRREDKFSGVRWRAGPVTGMPVLDSTIAHAECVLHDEMDAGDHVIVLGRLVGGEAASGRSPLGYWRGNYVRLDKDPT